jgi:hypothetical protein
VENSTVPTALLCWRGRRPINYSRRLPLLVV